MHSVPETFKHMWVQRGDPDRAFAVPTALGAPVLALFSTRRPDAELPRICRRAARRRSSADWGSPFMETALCCKGKVAVHTCVSAFTFPFTPTLKGEKQTTEFRRNGQTKSECLWAPHCSSFGSFITRYNAIRGGRRVINCRH